ncbi:Hypothetical protein FKW44_003886, partial [Caligus rogercresseyi]
LNFDPQMHWRKLFSQRRWTSWIRSFFPPPPDVTGGSLRTIHSIFSSETHSLE